MTFQELSLIEPLLRSVRAAGYTQPTPIQAQAIPPLLKGRDLLGCAQTGTGKTAAFALPILQQLAASPRNQKLRALVLAPTRELAMQIVDSFKECGRFLPMLRYTVIFGGVGQAPQVRALQNGVDVLVATPGRLLDLSSQRLVDLSGVQYLVLDEADRMLDMGFVHDVQRILKLLPGRRQNMLFSATMPGAILKLSSQILKDPVQVSVTPPATTADKVAQRVHFVNRSEKRAVLASMLLKDPSLSRVVVFTRTKHGANRVAEGLQAAHIGAAAIHGNKSQSAREKALEGFRSGETRVLVATDIAARGIDVVGITHVINFDLPNEPETYVHRIGRTARAGAAGCAVSLCDPEERAMLRDIERLIRQQIPEARV